jgi:hypothetical protein
MRFQVPQFIEVEDKIFGPYTLKQFIYMAGGLGISFVIFEFVPLIIAAPIILIIVAFSAALAFYKVNQKPFIFVVEAGVKYFLSTKLYIWKKEDRRPEPKTLTEQTDAAKRNYASVMVPKLSDSKLKDLTWSLDIKESMYSNKNQR